MSIITLTTDLGSSTSYAGALYGLIWQTSPAARIVDLTHEIPPGDILAAQVVLENAVPYFPPGTIHVAAVAAAAALDTEPPRVLAARLGELFFIGSDNGLITPMLEQAEADRREVEIYAASFPDFSTGGGELLPGASLHGACAMLAARLANGALPETLGQRLNAPVRVSTPEPTMLDDGWRGQVVQVDHFGNLTTNIRPAHLEGMRRVEVALAGQEIRGLSKTFGDGQPGDLLALLDSSNRLSICVVNGSAAERLNAAPGDAVDIRDASE